MTALRDFLDICEEAMRILASPHDEDPDTVKAAAELVADASGLARLVMSNG